MSTRREGFTVTELIVAMGIFVIMVTIAVGVFTNAVRSQRRLIELMAVNNNAGVTMEQIAREVRTGYRFCEGTGGGLNPADACAVTANMLSFTNYRGNEVTYALDASSSIVTRFEEGVDIAPLSLTAPEAEVAYLTFFVSQMDGNGASGDDVCSPWRITFVLGVKPRNAGPGEDETKLQTSVSSRVLPVEAPGAPESIIQTCQR